MNNRMIVYLVGAGPGDSGLITVKGQQCLQKADVVLYDRLCNPALLDEIAATTEQIYVGKNMGHHALPQEQINALLVEKARQGKIVVRLKGGDPFVFGRGGEEAEVLSAAGIPFEVVPGVTAGFAAGAYAGIPLTHRDFTTSVTLVTGHLKTGKERPHDIDWATLAQGNGTLVFYMGLSNISNICQQLIHHGRVQNTPVAVVSHASTPAQRTIIATLTTAAHEVTQHNITSPAVIIIGDVVQLHNQLSWFPRCQPTIAAGADEATEKPEIEVRAQTIVTTAKDQPRKNILIFTGNGKGKSTAAFGMALRAVGHKQRVRIVQFMKKDSRVGELIALKKLKINITQSGLGFVPQADNPQYAAHCEAAAQGLAVATDAIFSGDYDLIILDELCGALAHGLLDESAVIALLQRAPTPLNLVLTGRNATKALIELADTVSEINPVKHAYMQGINARMGVEF
ncbi:MAG: uroporphyrinogen-III C-methyltransferase [Desulfuromonas sp.]|nr:uroporphyrinogen-III C-methyltransferase [Desulfuromonas sp.]